jgi:hypothetical protein
MDVNSAPAGRPPAPAGIVAHALLWGTDHESGGTPMILIDCIRQDVLRHRTIEGGYAREYANYKRALYRVQGFALPPLSGPGLTSLDRLDEEVMALISAAWEAGAIVGDAFARAEMALETSEHVCDRCRGYGQHDDDKAHERQCGRCSGRGVVTVDSD